MTAMDTRLAERRKGVSEDRARRRLRWVLIVLGLVLTSAAAFWLIRSPILSIREVEVTGAVRSDPGAAVASLGMGVGRPTIDVSAGAIERAVEESPWVADATVSVLWPGRVVVDVIEYEPLVPVARGDGWFLVSAEGAVLEEAARPGPGEASVTIDLGAARLGDVSENRSLLGALEFIDALADDLRVGLVVGTEGDRIVATVDGHVVTLGRADDMAMKALVLESMIGAGLDPGVAVNLIAPSRPAVSDPQPQVEVEE